MSRLLLAAAEVPAALPATDAAESPANPMHSLQESLNLEQVSSWKDTFVNTFAGAMNDIIALTPVILAALVVLVLGYVVARFVAKFISTLCEAIGLQNAAVQGGLVQSMRQVGINRTVPAIVGTLVFWLLMCVFVMAAFNILGLEAVSTALQDMVAFIPKLLVATVVVVVGLLLAAFMRGVVATSADRVGLSYAETLATGVYYVVALLTFMAAFDQLGVQFALLRELILIAFGAVALGFGLAFGFGGRDVMGGILAGYYLRQRLHAGDRVSIAGLEGRVREVGPVATVIETDEDGLLNRRSIPNAKMLAEAVR
ncbi:MAG: mechanosensitive ion channel domain-containing protein [Pirellulales bacterium]